MAFKGYYFDRVWTQADDANTTVSVTDVPAGQLPARGQRKYQLDDSNPTTTGTWRKLVWVKNAAASAVIAANDLLHWSDAGRSTVDTRQAQGIADRNSPAGIGIGAIAAGSEGWLLVVGLVTLNLAAGDNPAKGATIITSTTDKKVASVAMGTASTHKPVGYAQAAASGAGGTVATWVEIEH